MLKSLIEIIKPKQTVFAHCDLPCGVYDPAQAKIEAQSVKACMEKYAASSDPDFKSRAVAIKEERSELVKHHLWVLWTDYFKPNHFEAYPQLHTLFNEATKLAGAGGGRRHHVAHSELRGPGDLHPVRRRRGCVSRRYLHNLSKSF